MCPPRWSRASSMNSWLSGRGALLLAVTMLTLGCSEARSADEEAAAAVVERFVLEMFGVSGDPAAAFNLIEPADRPNCDNKEFADIKDLGRTMVSGRRLSVEIKGVNISGDRGAVSFTTAIDGRSGLGLHSTASVVRVSDRWYYKMSEGRGCASAFAFFGMAETPPIATPVSQGNPGCHPAYPLTCIPAAPPVLTCDQIGIRNIVVFQHPDPHGLDPDRNGFGCQGP